MCLACLFPAISCGTNEESTVTVKEKDSGIHEKYERGPAIVTLDVDHKEITIAQRLHLSIRVTVNEDYEVELPAFGEKLEQFGIVDYHTTQPELMANNRVKVSRSYVLEPFLSGEYRIPPMEVRFWKKSEGRKRAHKIQTSELKIKVTSLLPEDLKKVTLHEIKPPVGFPTTLNTWMWAGIGGGVCLIALIAIIVFRRRRKAGKQAVEVQVPPHEAAYEALRRLVDEDLPAKGEIKLFYQRISGILRRYIESRFGLSAPEQTTEEFLSSLETAKSFPLEYRNLLKSFLNHCDLVKFAEHKPGKDDIRKTFDSCKSFIEGTRTEE